MKKIIFLFLLPVIFSLTCSGDITSDSYTQTLEGSITESDYHSPNGQDSGKYPDYYDEYELDYYGNWEFEVKYFDNVSIDIYYISSITSGGAYSWKKLDQSEIKSADCYVTEKLSATNPGFSYKRKIRISYFDETSWNNNTKTAKYEITGTVN